MCSIAGCLGGDQEAGRRFVERANRLMAHRGPNDEGVFVGRKVALANRRLAILDLSPAGHQPMISPDGRWVLVYNGEVYNHQELRRRFCQHWNFKGNSDTETVLALLSSIGPAAFEEMVGMWGLALWDTVEERLLLSRDRYGQKPLYWRRSGEGVLCFASEIKPLLADGESPACNATAVADFLALGNYGHLGNDTFFRDIYSFPAGHWAWVSPGQPLQPYRYWRFPTVPVQDRRPLDETVVKRFRECFQAAVTSQLLSDVKVGVTLSGGLDSSAVVGAIAGSLAQETMPVFTAQAMGHRSDESPYVRDVLEKWPGRLAAHWTPLVQINLQESLNRVMRIQEEPFGDPSIIAHGLLMDSARTEGVPVILGGQGGDELLFGYAWMVSALLAAGLRGKSWTWCHSEMNQLNISSQRRLRVMMAALFPGMEGLARNYSRQQKRSWLSQRLRESADHGPKMGAASDLVTMQLEAVEQVAIPHLTHYDDRNGMARSIETRMPFLDHRLADVLAELDPSAFLCCGHTKHILRVACADLLPPKVLARRDKIGFYTPLEVMIQQELDWVSAMLTDDFSGQLGFFDSGEIGRCVEICRRTTSDETAALRLWRCLAVRVWAEQFNVRIEN